MMTVFFVSPCTTCQVLLFFNQIFLLLLRAPHARGKLRPVQSTTTISSVGNDRGPGPGLNFSLAPAGAIKIISRGRGPQIAVSVLVFSTEFYFLHVFCHFEPTSSMANNNI